MNDEQRRGIIILLRKRGAPITAIGDAMGISRQRVYQILEKYAPETIEQRQFIRGHGREDRACPTCKTVFNIHISSKQKYCGKYCNPVGLDKMLRVVYS